SGIGVGKTTAYLSAHPQRLTWLQTIYPEMSKGALSPQSHEWSSLAAYRSDRRRKSGADLREPLWDELAKVALPALAPPQAAPEPSCAQIPGSPMVPGARRSMQSRTLRPWTAWEVAGARAPARSSVSGAHALR